MMNTARSAASYSARSPTRGHSDEGVQSGEPALSNSWRLVSLGRDCPPALCPSISDTCRQENGDGNREAVKKHGRARQRHKPMLLARADEVIE